MAEIKNVFDAVDEASPRGLEAMLKTVAAISSEKGDYGTACRAQIQLKRLELGLPENAQPNPKKAAWKKFEKAERRLETAAAKRYKANNNLVPAAKHFYSAKKYEQALDAYLEEGSDESLNRAAAIAIHRGIDYRLGFDLRISREEFSAAFIELGLIKYPEQQKWGGYLARAFHDAMVEGIRAKITRQEGNKPAGKTIPELLEGRQGEEFLSPTFTTHLFEAIRYTEDSEYPRLIEAAIGFYAYCASVASSEHGKEIYKAKEIFLRGKLRGDEAYIQHFMEKAAEQARRGDPSSNHYAELCVKLLQHRKEHDKALEIAEKYLPRNDRLRIEILEKLGHKASLSSIYKDSGDPVKYALTLAP